MNDDERIEQALDEADEAATATIVNSIMTHLLSYVIFPSLTE